AMGSSLTRLSSGHAAEWLRSRLSPSWKRRVRAFTDPIGGPIGSICGARTESKVLAVTFDDGPDPLYTPRILDSLAEFRATATWFVLLDRSESHSRIIHRIRA